MGERSRLTDSILDEIKTHFKVPETQEIAANILECLAGDIRGKHLGEIVRYLDTNLRCSVGGSGTALKFSDIPNGGIYFGHVLNVLTGDVQGNKISVVSRNPENSKYYINDLYKVLGEC